MDFVARRLVAIAGLGVLLAAAAAPPLRALRWLAPGSDPVAAMAWQPTECLRATPADAAPTDAAAVEIGRAAFRSPLLLGGQASRAGLSCNSCHRNGRGNPQFHFPGLSGAPGTADVTSSLFSSHRGDGIDNPKPIPDLSGPAATRKISRDPQAQALEPFIHGLIVNEFDGAEPPPTVLAGVAAYVRGLDAAACPAQPTERVTLAGSVADARRAVQAARAALHDGDRATAATLALAARTQLGLIAERYAAEPGLAADLAALRNADRALADTLVLIHAGKPGADTALTVWLADAPNWEATLSHDAWRSLFDERQLRAMR